MKSFERDYRYGTGDTTRTNSLAVGLQQLGAFVACFLAWPMTNKLGRKYSLMISSFVFCIGAAIQTINTHSLPAFYVARVIAGLGLGAATVVVPMFSSEMVPKEMRATCGSFFQWFFTFVRRPATLHQVWNIADSSRASSHPTGSTTVLPSTCHRTRPSSGKSPLASRSCPRPCSVSEC